MKLFIRNEEKKEAKNQNILKYNAVTQEIINKVGCPYEVFGETCSVETVNKAYESALQRGSKEGFVPVLVPCDETLAEWLGILDEEDHYSIQDTLKADTENGEQILQNRYNEYMHDLEEDFGEGEQTVREFRGELKGGETLEWLTSFAKYEGDGIRETILFEIPTVQPWKVFAWLPMGGWNECPEVKEMMAICRYWYEKYGSMPAVITHDTLEFTVPHPVTEEEAAWKLAEEHFAFTPDRVDQCTENGTLGEVADSIRKSTIWYFWWD